jgi:PAS domain S-box-containing protein
MTLTMSAKANILIVDDESLVAEDIKAALIRQGYAVSAVAEEADEAVTLTGVHHPDLVLMDIRLRGPESGIAAAHSIRTRTGTPVVFLTAYSDEETLRQASAVEPHGYLVKPFRDEELHAVVEMALHRHRREQKSMQADECWKAVFRVSPDAVVLMDEGCRILEWNPAAERLFRRSSAEVEGRLLPSFFAPDLSLDTAHVRVFQSLATTAEAQPGQRMDMTGVRADGTTFPTEFALLRLERPEGSIYAAFVRDLTERKRLEEEMSRFVGHLMKATGTKKPFPEFVPVCAACHKARRENGEWVRMEAYLMEHIEIAFTHGYCRPCAAKFLALVQPEVKQPQDGR